MLEPYPDAHVNETSYTAPRLGVYCWIPPRSVAWRLLHAGLKSVDRYRGIGGSLKDVGTSMGGAVGFYKQALQAEEVARLIIGAKRCGYKYGLHLGEYVRRRIRGFMLFGVTHSLPHPWHKNRFSQNMMYPEFKKLF